MKNIIKFMVLLVIAIMAMTFSAAAEDVVLMDMSTTGLTFKNVETTQEYTNNYDSSRKVIMKDSSNTGAEIGSAYSTAKDLSGYSYFNMWVYSPKANNAKFDIDIYNKLDGTNNTRVARYTVITDWQGWKLVSAPFVDFALEDNISEIDWTAVTKYRVTSYSTAWTWTEGDFLCIDKIWCSTDNPYAVAESEPIIDYNDANTTLSKLSTGVTNTRVLEKSLKYSEKTTEAGREGICTLSSAVDVSECDFINMWVYLSENPQYTKDETTMTPKLRLRLGDGAVTPATSSSCQYTKLDWQGWKLMTVPLTEFTSSSGNVDWSKIIVFKIITNVSGWTNSQFAKDMDIYFDKIWFSKEAPVAASPGITGVISANGDSNFRSLDSAIELNLNKNANLAKADAFTVTEKVSGKTVSVTPYLIAPGKISLFLGDKLADNTEYTVNIAADAVMDGDGFGNAATTFDFTTRPAEFKADEPAAYDYATKLASGIATDSLKAVTKLYNTTNQDKTVTLYVAVYGSDNSLKSIALKEHTIAAMSEVTVDTITKVGSEYTYATKEATDEVRCFIWESGNLTPVGLID